MFEKSKKYRKTTKIVNYIKDGYSSGLRGKIQDLLGEIPRRFEPSSIYRIVCNNCNLLINDSSGILITYIT